MKRRLSVTAVTFGHLNCLCEAPKPRERDCGKERSKNRSKSELSVFLSEQFADLKCGRYQFPGWENLEIEQKELFVLPITSQLLAGRDNHVTTTTSNNQLKPLEEFRSHWLSNYLKVITASEEVKENFMVYTKRVWFCKWNSINLMGIRN